MKKDQIAIIFDCLKKIYPDPKTELEYSTDFQLLVAVILSAQTTDKQVNKVTRILFKKVKEPEDLIRMGFEKFRKSISSINYFNSKAKNIYKTTKILRKSRIPDRIDKLIELPGVGIKTAKVVLHVIYDMPVIAVDTHVHRVSNRLGLVNTKNPQKTSELLEKKIPNKYKSIAHHTLILFGRYQCIARNPKCGTCVLKGLCRHYRVKNGIKSGKVERIEKI